MFFYPFLIVFIILIASIALFCSIYFSNDKTSFVKTQYIILDIQENQEVEVMLRKFLKKLQLACIDNHFTVVVAQDNLSSLQTQIVKNLFFEYPNLTMLYKADIIKLI